MKARFARSLVVIFVTWQRGPILANSPPFVSWKIVVGVLTIALSIGGLVQVRLLKGSK